MADSFLGRWFGRRSGKETEAETKALREELDRLAAARPALLPPARWLRDVLPELTPVPGPVPAIEPERARAKLHGGVPLLRGERVEVDLAAFGRRWRRVCEALAARQGDDAVSALADAVRPERLDGAEMVDAVVAGRPEVVRERAEGLGLEPGLTTTVLRFSLFGPFTALEASLAPLRDGVPWDRGYCPTCGSWPLLGEFRGLDQSRFLRCGLCAAGWEAARLWCPFCGNRDHERLGLLHDEAEEKRYRASVCDDCRGYVKTVTSLTALAPLQLLVADVLTLHLDLAAAERGYTSHF